VSAKDPFFAIWRILSIQVAVLVLFAAIIVMYFGYMEARSVLLGGLTGFLPNLYFAFRMSAARGKPAKQIVRAFYSGESIKLFITVGLFILVFQVPELKVVSLFAGYIVVLLVFWYGLLIRDRE